MIINNITLAITTKCNLHCSYCFCGEKSSDTMSIDTAKRAVDMLKKCATNNPTITFFGGEPLLAIDLIDDICDYAKKTIKDVKFSMTTNGTLLIEKALELINKWNISYMVSIDGMEEEHNSNRVYYNGTGSWNDVMSNLMKLFPLPSIRLTFTSKSIYKLYDSIIQLHDRGFDNIVFSHTIEPKWDEESCKEYKKQYVRLVQYYLECFRKKEKLVFTEFDDIILSHVLKKKRYCSPGLHQIAILPDGRVIPCHRVNFLNPEVILAANIEDLINLQVSNETLQSWQEQIKKGDDECDGCELINRCTSCYFENRALTSSVSKIPEIICYFNKVKIMEVDRMASILYKEQNEEFLHRFYDRFTDLVK